MTPRSSISPALCVLTALLVVATAQDVWAQNELEHCAHPIGTLAVVEPQPETINALELYDLSSPTSLIRMMVQQSNCFQVVERGLAMQTLMQERELAQAGQMRQDADIGGGQMVAADFVLTPEVVISNPNAGGIGGAVGGLLGQRGRTLRAIGGTLRFQEAHTSLLIADTRSGIQVAAADGQARRTDFRIGMIGFGRGRAAALGGYTNSDEGKVIAASFLDNYNNIVVTLRNNPALQQRAAGAVGDVAAGAVFHAGDILVPKIDNVQVLAAPSADASVVGHAARNDEFVFLGDEQDGFVTVQGATLSGWVRTVLVDRP